MTTDRAKVLNYISTGQGILANFLEGHMLHRMAFIYRNFWVFFIVCAFAVSIANQANACMFMEGFEQSVEKYDLIFTGKYADCVVESGHEYIIINSDTVWKGERYDSYKHKLSCNKRYMKKSKTYLIYSYVDSGSNNIVPAYGLASCSRTAIVVPWWYTLFQKIIRYFGVEEVHISHVHDDIAKLNELFEEN